MPTKGKYMQEMAVRIVLHALEASANRYRRHIVPLLSVGIDFYLRVFVRVYTSPAEVKKASLKTSLVYQSLGCGSFHLQPAGRFHAPQRGAGSGHFSAPTGPTCPPKCAETGSGFRVGGPIWSAPMHDMEWVLEALRRAEEEEDGKGPLALPTRCDSIDSTCMLACFLRVVECMMAGVACVSTSRAYRTHLQHAHTSKPQGAHGGPFDGRVGGAAGRAPALHAQRPGRHAPLHLPQHGPVQGKKDVGGWVCCALSFWHSRRMGYYSTHTPSLPPTTRTHTGRAHQRGVPRLEPAQGADGHQDGRPAGRGVGHHAVLGGEAPRGGPGAEGEQPRGQDPGPGARAAGQLQHPAAAPGPKKKVKRFPPNPEAFWGPKARARGSK